MHSQYIVWSLQTLLFFFWIYSWKFSTGFFNFRNVIFLWMLFAIVVSFMNVTHRLPTMYYFKISKKHLAAFQRNTDYKFILFRINKALKKMFQVITKYKWKKIRKIFWVFRRQPVCNCKVASSIEIWIRHKNKNKNKPTTF